MRAALAAEDGESLLDVGCGTGIFGGLGRGTYVGIDVFLPYLRFARGRSGAGRHYAAMRADALGFADRTFDVALVMNLIHHLDAPSADRLLAELGRVTRKRVLLMDAAPDLANPIERFLLRHDRGAFVRSREELRSLLARHFRIEREEAFHNAMQTAPQVVFTLVPTGRRRNAD